MMPAETRTVFKGGPFLRGCMCQTVMIAPCGVSGGAMRGAPAGLAGGRGGVPAVKPYKNETKA